MGRTIEVDDPVVSRAIDRVSHAAALGHSGRPFMEHLLGTWRILRDWGMPDAVCRAGFMHSAYSTSFYPNALFRLDQREIVRAMIGREAEDLAFRFCTMDRHDYWCDLVRSPRAGTLTYLDRLHPAVRVPVARRTLRSLLIIESANIAEQSSAADAGPAPWMSRLFHWWEFLDDRSIPLRLGVRPSLTEQADECAIDVYRRALTAPPRRAMSLLDDAMEHNPWAAEPRILRAICSLDAGDEGALTAARRGADLISAWAVTWDKRLSIGAWKALSDRSRRAGVDPSTAKPGFRSVCEILSGRAPKPRWLVL